MRPDIEAPIRTQRRALLSALVDGDASTAFHIPSIPPHALAEYLEMQEPLALVLSVAASGALVVVGCSCATADETGVRDHPPRFATS